MIWEFLAAALFAGFTSAILCPIVMAVGVWDNPDPGRKTHAVPTPTAGGLAAAGAFALALALLALWPWPNWTQTAPGDGFLKAALATLAASAALSLGLWDDIHMLGPRLKFGLMSGIAVLVTLFVARAEAFPLAGPYVAELGFAVGVLGSALWVFTLTNTVNFMDGANGLAMGATAVGLTGLGAVAIAHDVPHAAAVALPCAGALTGLLVWNFPKGQIFAGDAGALFVGMLAATASLILVQDGGVSPVIPALIFFPLLADVLLTLAYRVMRRRVILNGHREHLFQIAIRGGLQHWQISLIYWGATLHCGVIAFLVSFGPKLAPPDVFATPAGDVPANQIMLTQAAGWVASGAPLLTLIAFAVVAMRISRRLRAFAAARGLDTP